jgi:uncharacterized membrane protein YphA (DoxX/SURF4 family)
MVNVIKRKTPAAARIVLGLVFTVFGLNGFLNFLPQPPSPPEAAAFGGALAASGYFFPLLKGVEVVAGILLLSGRYVPLALTVLAPIIVNIVAFHLFLAPGGLGMAALLVAAELVLAWAYRDSFRGVLAANARPHVADEPERRSVGGEAISRA